MPKPLVAGVLAAVALTAGESRLPDAPSPAPNRARQAVTYLHDGRFDEAEALLSVAPVGGTTRRWDFLRAYVTYWRLIFDARNPDLLTRLEQQLDAALDRGAIPDGATDRSDALWSGSCRLIRAEVYAGQNNYLKAGYEAKRARALLLEAAEADLPDASFGLGTYNYAASRLPAIVKGLRFVLALPGGDHDLGIEQLEAAARDSPHFSLEARILLVSILSSREERRYLQALRHAREALDGEQTVAVLYASALLDLSLGRPRAATRRLGRALARANRHAGTDGAVVARIRLQLARAELGMFRPDLALERLHPLLDRTLDVPVSMQQDLDRLVARASRWTPVPQRHTDGDPSGGKPSKHPATDETARAALLRARPALDLEADGDLEASAQHLLELVESDPDNPALALLAGRALVLLRRPDPRASALLRVAVERASMLPRPWQGSSRLFAGHAADLNGDRDAAQRFYREAQQSPAFMGKSAAYFYREHPFPGPQ